MKGHVTWRVDRRTPKGWFFAGSFLMPSGSREADAIQRFRELVPTPKDEQLRARKG